jgi:hypothetical protein
MKYLFLSMSFILFFALFGCSDPDLANPQVDREKLSLQTVKNAVARNAICNNGGAYTYYLRPGTGEGLNRWVIFTEGGGACSSISECETRFASEKGKMVPATETTIVREGIFEISPTQNPDFWDWNHVFLNYCSSDGWTGNKAASVETGEFHFQGYLIVKSVIEDLLDSSLTTPSLSKADFLVFAGGSAGGQGQINNLDRVAEQIHVVRPEAKIVGVTDSFYHPPVPPYEVGVVPVAYTKDNIPNGTIGASYDFWGAKPDETCVTDNSNDPGVCMNGQIAYEYLNTRNFVFEDQFDEERMRKLGVFDTNPEPPIQCTAFTAEQSAWIMPYSEIVRDSVKTAAHFGGGFSTAAGFHTALMERARFVDFYVDGSNYRTVLGNWVFERPGPQRVVDDTPCSNSNN